MNYNKFNILLTSVLVIIIYFTIPYYNGWLFGKVLNSGSIAVQAANLDPEYRKEQHFGLSYNNFRSIKRFFSKKHGVVLLTPTNEYLRAMDINNVDVAEPAIFYYFTGVNTVLPTSPNVENANWAIVISKEKGLHVVEVKSKPQLDSLITLYKQYMPKL